VRAPEIVDPLVCGLTTLQGMQNLKGLPGRSRTFSVGVGGLVCLLSVSTFATPAFADQFVLFDATFDYSWEDANNSTPSKSHYYVNDDNWMNLDRPGDWVSPVNYRDGSVHIRVEVLEKPAGDQEVGWGLCYIANEGAYGCPYSDYYQGVGVYENDVAMSAFWKSGPITWEAGVKQVDLVYTVNNSGSGHVHNFPELAESTAPTSVRITMVQVSEGDTYDPSILGVDEPTGTGGAGTGGEAGVPASGGGAATGGAAGIGTGGESASGGVTATGGASTGAGGVGNPPAGSDESGGCSLVAGEKNADRPGAWLFLMAGLLVARRVQRRSVE
jgi:MYXO-CTERM domain-containing protein